MSGKNLDKLQVTVLHKKIKIMFMLNSVFEN